MQIQAIDFPEYGYAWIREGLGIHTTSVEGPYYAQRFRITDRVELPGGTLIPLRPMVGIVGVATETEISTRFPGRHGGNTRLPRCLPEQYPLAARPHGKTHSWPPRLASKPVDSACSPSALALRWPPEQPVASMRINALFISPDSFHLSESIYIATMVIIGGRATILGPLIGAIVLTAVPEALRFAGGLQFVLYGLMLMVVVIFMPKGLVGLLDRFKRKSRSVQLTTLEG